METSFQKPSNPPHLGRNIQYIREAIGLKPDALGRMTKSNLEEFVTSVPTFSLCLDLIVLSKPQP